MRCKFHRSKLALGLEQYRIFDMTSPKQTSVVAAFRAMHESGCFVLPNPWDIGTAIYLEHFGFEALATTSARSLSRGGNAMAVCRVMRCSRTSWKLSKQRHCR